MKSAVQRLLWQRTLTAAGPLRRPLPVAAHFQEVPLQQRVRIEPPQPAPVVHVDAGAGDDMTAIMVRTAQPPAQALWADLAAAFLERRCHRTAQEFAQHRLGQPFDADGQRCGGACLTGESEPESSRPVAMNHQWQRELLHKILATPPERLLVTCPRRSVKTVFRRELTELQRDVERLRQPWFEVVDEWEQVRQAQFVSARCAGPQHARRSGITSQQMHEAPHGAVFLWVRDDLHYPRNLARHLGRTDLRIVGPAWLDMDRWRGTRAPVVVDHAAPDHLTATQRDVLRAALDYIERCGVART